MKKSLLIALILTVMFLNFGVKSVAANACIDESKLGSVKLSIPELNSTGKYNIWTRVQISDADNNQFLLEVNGNDCFVVGGSTLSTGVWQWVSYYDGNVSNRISYEFSNSKNNTIKLYGKDRGVKIDRVLIVKGDCIPVDLGNNCQSNYVPEESIQTAGAIEVPTIASQDGGVGVGGVVIPSATITQELNSVSKVIYYSDGSPVPTASNFGLDTTLLTNGLHRISMQITMLDGTVKNEVTTLLVENSPNAFAPLRRFYRFNEKAIKLLGAVSVSILFILIVIIATKNLLLRKRQMTFRGF